MPFELKRNVGTSPHGRVNISPPKPSPAAATRMPGPSVGGSPQPMNTVQNSTGPTKPRAPKVPTGPKRVDAPEADSIAQAILRRR